MKEDVLRAGDELIITEVDRLGTNKQETVKELQYYRDNGIRVKILELPTTLMDLSKLDNAMARMLMETINNMLIELYAAMAQAEIEKKEKRQREGSYVEKVLCYFRDRDKFSNFKKCELKNYEKFKEILIEFRTFYALEEYNLKEIDKYIWQLGKRYFPNNYGKKK